MRPHRNADSATAEIPGDSHFTQTETASQASGHLSQPSPPACPASNSVIGRTFGALTVVSFVCFRGRRAYFLCRCTCTRTRVASSQKLRDGAVRACRDCAREPAQEKARALSTLRPADVAANWRDHLAAFTPKQRAAYYAKLASRPRPVTDADRASTVAEVLITWRDRTLAHAAKGGR